MNSDLSEREKHPNQVFSQIILPLILCLLLVGAGAYLLFSGLVSGSADFRMTSDISVAILFLPLVLIGPVVMFVFMIKIVLLSTIQEKVRILFGKVSPFIISISEGISKFTQILAKPLILLKTGFSFFAGKK